MKKLMMIALVAVMLFSAEVHAQNIEYVGSTLWTGIGNSKVIGNYIYCVSPNGLLILAITYPASPTFVGQCFLPGDGTAIDVAGNYAFLSNRDSYLQIVDVSNLSNPTLVREMNTADRVSDIFVSGVYAYLAESYSALQIISIADPANPVPAGAYETTDYLTAVFVAGSYAYLSGLELKIINISDPANPTLTGSLNMNGFDNDVCVSGNYAYLLNSATGLQAIDISNPAGPHLDWSHRTYTEANSIYISGDYAYLAEQESAPPYSRTALQIFNLTSRDSVGIYTAYQRFFYYVSGIGDYVFLSGGGLLQTFHVNDPGNPEWAGEYDDSVYPLFCAVSGRYAYVSDIVNGLQIVDIADPAGPRLAGNIPLAALSDHIILSGNYSYMMLYDSYDSLTLQILNMTDSLNPSVAGSCAMAGQHNGFCISGNYVYVAAGPWGLNIVDISNPDDPRLLTTFHIENWVLSDVDIAGNYAFVLDRNLGLQIIDISAQPQPRLAGSVDTPGSAVGIAVSGSHAYIADGEAGLQVVDISDPSSPRIAGSCRPFETADLVFVSGHYAYLSDGNNFYIVDVTDPTQPVEINNYPISGYISDIYVTGNYIYLCNYLAFIILRYETTGIREVAEIPISYSVFKNYPNPFNASTTISYSLAKEGPVQISLYNIIGQKVAIIADEVEQAGEHKVVWDAGSFPSGVYLARLESGGAIEEYQDGIDEIDTSAYLRCAHSISPFCLANLHP